MQTMRYCVAIRLDKPNHFFKNRVTTGSGVGLGILSVRFFAFRIRFRKFIQRRKRKEREIMTPPIPFKKTIVMLVFFSCAALAGAQALRPLKPLPPKKDARGFAAAPSLAPGSPWQLLTNQPPVIDYTDCGPGNPILLTDGTVILQDDGCQDWWKLTPDQFGSYVNGTWTQLASTPAGYSPLYHSSAVLPDGRVIIEGGEYNFLNPVWTNLGAIYDPRTNTWTMVNPPTGWSTIGDAQGVVLSNGTFMQANCCTIQTALLNLSNFT